MSFVNTSGLMQEAFFYNALNIALYADHGLLRKVRAAYGSWEDCWHSLGSPGAAPHDAWIALRDAGIDLSLRGTSCYPRPLAEIPHPPFGIYHRGDAVAADGTAEGVAVAIVGTRKASTAGKELAREFAGALARSGCTVVSGLAFGIDAAAHKGALAAGGRTVAVLASGLDRVYPSSHRHLAGSIIEGGGALISEYPPGSPPLGYRFLERNRIISGLTKAVLVIEAPERSGVIATARFAMEQNRDLFVVPGPTDHPNYKGSHRLIRTGATLVADPDELLEDLGLEAGSKPSNRPQGTPMEEKILAVIRSAGRPLTIDEIIEAATLTSSIVNQTLTALFLKNAVREEGGRYSLR